jgi:hypothetical protein
LHSILGGNLQLRYFQLAHTFPHMCGYIQTLWFFPHRQLQGVHLNLRKTDCLFWWVIFSFIGQKIRQKFLCTGHFSRFRHNTNISDISGSDCLFLTLSPIEKNKQNTMSNPQIKFFCLLNLKKYFTLWTNILHAYWCCSKFQLIKMLWKSFLMSSSKKWPNFTRNWLISTWEAKKYLDCLLSAYNKLDFST